MKILGVIPARYASTRFPGKPLAMIKGKPMVQRVYEQAIKASLTDVVVATDDERIAEVVRSFGGNVVMTSADHPSGTDRCAEAMTKYKSGWDAVINIQGDEPYIHPNQINILATILQREEVEIGTLIKKIDDPEELLNVNTPKVVINSQGEALYFSRQAIPYKKGEEITEWVKHHTYYKHIGIYGYKSTVLPKLTQLKQSSLEVAESLEQLRWLENGYRIATGITVEETLAVDTPDDLLKAQSIDL
jgi:3-deoxy-manno-octulosonate cytidylyltransferase (CMP-KDO synthetase)